MSRLLPPSGRLPSCLHESDTVYGLPTSKATISAKATHHDEYLISTTLHRQRGLEANPQRDTPGRAADLAA